MDHVKYRYFIISIIYSDGTIITAPGQLPISHGLQLQVEFNSHEFPDIR